MKGGQQVMLPQFLRFLLGCVFVAVLFVFIFWEVILWTIIVTVVLFGFFFEF
jgi:hypothetical protein